MTHLLSLSLLLLAAPSRAGETPACEGEPTAWIDALRAGPDLELYLCLAHSDAAHDALVEASRAATAEDDGAEGDGAGSDGAGGDGAEVEAGEANRITRALAVHLLQRLDRPLVRDEVLLLNAGDMRLLRDGIHARRGRATPSPAHARVFERFDWYQPREDYSNRLLDGVDRQNIDLLDDPEPPAPPAAPTAAEAVAEAEAPAVPRGMCGCSAATAPGAGLFALALPLALLLRRRG